MDTKQATIRELESFRKKRKIDDWKITSIKIRKANQYLTKKFEKESFLTSERDELHVTVYKRLGKTGKKLGDSSFIVTDDSSSAIRQSISEAISLCRYAIKERYSLPSPQKIKKKTLLADREMLAGFREQNIHVAMQKVCDKIKKQTSKYKNIKVNGMELLLTTTLKEVINSRKVNMEQEKTFAYLEFVLTAFSKKKGEKKEMEFFPSITVSRLSDLDIKRFVDENVKLAIDVLNSSNSIRFEGPVMLSGDAVKEFFVPEQSLNPLFTHCSARIAYMHLSKYKKGKPIISGFEGDRITASTNPLISYNPASSDFDEEGVVSKKVRMIDKGLFKGYFGSKRFADYLKTEATGSIGSIEIMPGPKTERQIRANKRIVEIVSFSSFVPNAISGDFSAEIRLGYLWENGRKAPFKGGMFTGNVFSMIQNAHFSKEKKTLEGYSGPKAVVFNKAVIAGI
ncbi:MAG: hypothetical protein KJ574_03095 [Nanoarchaeota archaeon]|nr:hypothetical protein [Nanoarchaeota archaeon]